MRDLNPKFAIHISTKNRVNDLLFTLESCHKLQSNTELQIVVFDDGSTDGTSEKVKQNFPNVLLYRNEISKGYIYCRNKMLNETQAEYAISLDDDANFIYENSLEKIETYFNENQHCGVIAFRIFWGLELPSSLVSKAVPTRVKGFVGCGHAWRMSSWKSISNYPEWFVFYGEEQFASYQLFKNNIEVHYLPSVFVHHRVDMLYRSTATDTLQRNRFSLRSGWFLFFLFIPFPSVIQKFSYSFYSQFTNKIILGDWIATKGILLAFWDLILHLPKIITQRQKISNVDYKFYLDLHNTKIYWKPNED